MTRDQWLAEFARRLDVEPPTEREVEQLLNLAGLAAHASERTAAPIACWIAGRSPQELSELLELAREIA
ncbi:MAG: DUF6457 domain-containing protein [Solirubrobacteraceae bacterium]